MGRKRLRGRHNSFGDIKKGTLTRGRHAGTSRPWARRSIITGVVGSCRRVSTKWGTQYDLHSEKTSLAAVCGLEAQNQLGGHFRNPGTKPAG